MAVFQNLNVGDGKIPADKFQVETAAAILPLYTGTGLFSYHICAPAERLAKQKADQIRDLPVSSGPSVRHSRGIPASVFIISVTFLVLLTNTKPG